MSSNVAVYLLETSYEDGMQFEEIFIHIPGTDVWVTDTGYYEENLENVMFTQRFWDKVGEEHVLTLLGEL